jgi:molybdate-binding protein
LANLIEWTSQDKGDGTGYDIQSFNEDGSTRYIEVKTTNAGASTPFYVSQNELDFSEEVGESFFIYRVFDFSTDPKFYELRGALTITAHLEATAYRARPLSKAELVLEKEAVPDESDL